MKFISGAVLFLFAAALYHNVEESSANKARKSKDELNLLPCKAAVSYLMKTMMGGISTCTKTMKFKNGKDKAAKTTCIMKCVMTTEKLLTPEGLLDMSLIDAFMESQVPDKYIPTVKPMISRCLGGPDIKLDPTEEYCKSYEAPIKCMMEEIPKFCDSYKGE